jgi:hypothetical protein
MFKIITLFYIINILQIISAIEVYLDTHTHSKYDKNDSIWSPDDCVKWHIDNGYNAMVITNHMPDEYLPPSFFKNTPQNFTILPGREYAIQNYHIVIIFNPLTYEELYPNLPSLIGPNPFTWCYDREWLKTVIEEWHKLGVIVILAHPHLRENICEYNPPVCDLKNIGFDYVERITSGIFDFKNYRDELSCDFSVVSGTDGHDFFKTVPGGYTRMRLNKLSAQNIFDALYYKNITDIYVELSFSRINYKYKLIIAAVIVLICLIISGISYGLYYSIKKCNCKCCGCCRK